ncbi:DUF6247 family protein [Mycobacteroides salmoniphilum]|uniref:Uncharacterized protein n=1 Tax=Mycobacteroides salmoniphilum TaxID=404941 RepID=A0A4R8SWK4_9MYCO|nr:DUF6247 family protein [Mycobacteroides salmoniphilum]TEA06742.1 hypothetical protein CCUG60884_01880 [Mycobacteroides salmoniphilum]
MKYASSEDVELFCTCDDVLQQFTPEGLIGWAHEYRAALAQTASDELSEFEAEFRIALAETDDDFDLERVDRVLNRWWGRAYLQLNPPTETGRAFVEQATRGNFRNLAAPPEGR